MATNTYNGGNVTNTASGATVTWNARLTVTITDYPTYVAVAYTGILYVHGSAAPYFKANRNSASLSVGGSTVKSYSGPSSATNLKGATTILSYTANYQKTTTAQNKAVSFKIVSSSASWGGTSTATVTGGITIPALASYTVDYDANGGSGSISSQTKYYSIALPLSDGTGFSRANHSLTGWNTASDGSGTQYEPSGSFTDNADTTLYATWHLDYLAPTITNLGIYRVATSSSTTETDDGEYIHIGFNYVGGSLDGGSTHIPPKVKVIIDGVQEADIQQTSDTGTFSANYGTYSKDTVHTVVVAVYDVNAEGVTYTEQITTATYPIDLRANGIDVYMGIMTPAVVGQTLTLGDTNVDGDIDADGDVNVAGNYKINGVNLSASDVGALDASLVADYVVEEGVDGVWTYRKWSSGKVEAWATYPFVSASWNVWNNPIRYMDKSINIPSGIFETSPSMLATARENQYWIVHCTATSEITGNMRIASVASTAMATSANIYAWTS